MLYIKTSTILLHSTAYINILVIHAPILCMHTHAYDSQTYLHIHASTNCRTCVSAQLLWIAKSLGLAQRFSTDFCNGLLLEKLLKTVALFLIILQSPVS